MRLTLAVSMLKHADLVLLDEPTRLGEKWWACGLGEAMECVKTSWTLPKKRKPTLKMEPDAVVFDTFTCPTLFADCG